MKVFLGICLLLLVVNCNFNLPKELQNVDFDDKELFKVPQQIQPPQIRPSGPLQPRPAFFCS